eukprot:TRINITY_DN3196_c0_g1_i1.p1 TRINITY_DN3196_c0_g1~~TRINITY_DN3196_c0_g1_i1.p1  ORF type:complete len:175 (-),score=24.85 TRINITY_DN3196_c0_g1_i1:206-730(-)
MTSSFALACFLALGMRPCDAGRTAAQDVLQATDNGNRCLRKIEFQAGTVVTKRCIHVRTCAPMYTKMKKAGYIQCHNSSLCPVGCSQADRHDHCFARAVKSDAFCMLKDGFAQLTHPPNSANLLQSTDGTLFTYSDDCKYEEFGFNIIKHMGGKGCRKGHGDAEPVSDFSEIER